MSDRIERTPGPALGVLVVRRGPGANCSSIGSAVEMLFLSASAGAAILAAVTASLGHGGECEEDEPPSSEPKPPPDEDTP